MRYYESAFASAVRILLVGALVSFSMPAVAEMRVLVAVDPSDAVSNNVIGIGSLDTLSKSLNTKAIVTKTQNLSDAMRASRTVENDVIIGPAHVTASAVSHAYKLLATTGSQQEYALVARKEIESIEKLKGKHVYLPQQDSLPTYLAKGLIRESGLSFKSLGKVTYGRTSGAGLLSVSYGMADAAIASLADVNEWMKSHPDAVHILKKTRPVPDGMNLMVRKDISPIDEDNVLKWISSAEGMASGLGRLQVAANGDSAKFHYVASLGIFTPNSLPNVTIVTAEQVMDLAAKGAVIYDTRSPKEYALEHIKGAVAMPYQEKSLKDVDYDASLDDFSVANSAPRQAPAIFLCNGPECWKSYKASRAALAMGFEKVYWFRGGMPEWREKTLPVMSSLPAKTNLAAAKR
ncbi:rhodanese-like domain-containing protein [Noviherbaspirillum massiliense]|uniref:rhodanese-like domain-containing protein n=1 Tax=Noviherbaspirillum massiliense TaxID=1465823 RepID=UPI0013759A19|nr:rhodanese-like domain-containing protein [Noviherbaspirillum massiliense]